MFHNSFVILYIYFSFDSLIGCGNNEFTCSNGECIRASLECDGGRDCRDGTDEHARCGMHNAYYLKMYRISERNLLSA